MEQYIRKFQEQLGAVLLERMNPALDGVYKELVIWIQRYVVSIDKIINSLDSERDQQKKSLLLLSQYMAFCRSLLPLLDELHLALPLARKEQLGYDQLLFQFLQEQPSSQGFVQAPERFNSLPGDKWYIKSIKSYKRAAYAVFELPAKTCILFNKIVKKEVFIKACQVKPWKQKIPLRRLSCRYYNYELFNAYSEIVIDLHRELALSCTKIRELDELLFPAIKRSIGLDNDEKTFISEWEQNIRPALLALKKEFKSKQTHFSLQFQQALHQIQEDFREQAQVGGTLEFNSFRHWSWLNKRLAAGQRRRNVRHSLKRKNTVYAICDDWKFSQEIHYLSCNALKSSILFSWQIKDNRLDLMKLLLPIPDFLNDSLGKLQAEDRQNLKKILQQLKFDAGKELVNTIIAGSAAYVDRQDLLSLIELAAESVLKDLSGMTSKRSLIARFNPAKAYPRTALKSVSPYRLIQFEIGTAWNRVALQLKQQTQKDLESIHDQLKNLGRINLINLEAALVQLNDKKEEVATVAYQDARSGLERALLQYKAMLEYCDNMYLKLDQSMNKAVMGLVDALLDLAINENAEKIRLRILRADIKKRLTESYTIFIGIFTTLYKKAKAFLGLVKRETGAGIGSLKTKLGIQEQAKEITSEISEFLSFDYEDIQQLPFVYQRLFSNEPLSDASFFLSRDKESTELATAYQKWREGQFMPCLIYGEKGSGVSTLMEMFLPRNNKETPRLIKIIPDRRIYSTEDLLDLLGKSIRKKAFKDLNDLYEYIEQQDPFCVFLDKIHFMYLRQPKGFEVLKLLFSIISASSKTVFWICSCGQYSADYLNKTIGLYGYFPVLIQMRTLELERIIEIILLRHRASGYDLRFIPSNLDLADKRFTKTEEQLQQEILKTKYFSTLHNITESNISFALLLWLTSIQRIDNNRVYLESLDKLDFSFLYTQTREAVFGLHALLLHESLNSAELAAVLNCSERQATLLLMRLNDRGIVVKEDKFYKIHPLLYRSAVQMLKDNNLIH
ncbi:MAG: ATP-binding protein [Bacteroidales bacterium]|nr:ATP-binding protein [Bacteroidales bacterium]MDD4431141.1 ATP-binding protein [Bacteroidales bacterium]